MSVARFVQSPEARDPRPPPNVPPVPVFWTILQLVSSDPSVQSWWPSHFHPTLRKIIYFSKVKQIWLRIPKLSGEILVLISVRVIVEGILNSLQHSKCCMAWYCTILLMSSLKVPRKFAMIISQERYIRFLIQSDYWIFVNLLCNWKLR